MRRFFVAGIVLMVAPLLVTSWMTASGLSTSGKAECAYLAQPEKYLYSPERDRLELSARSKALDEGFRSVRVKADPYLLTRRNLIDDYIFSRLEKNGIQPAPLASDSEFLRRVTLDLTGRIPSIEDVAEFLQDTSSTKREDRVDTLIASSEFIDKWTMFFGDLFKANATASNIVLYQQGRDSMVAYLRDAVRRNKPYNQMATELITASGNNLYQGPVNWLASAGSDGPPQDTYDARAVITASEFLGINTVDCLLCHDGARHLDALNLWAKNRTRFEMWGLSAFFAETVSASSIASQQPFFLKFEIADQSGDYLLNTGSGNRVPRQPLKPLDRVAPRYPFTGEAPDPNEYRRQALASFITNDPQFSRAIVNFIWEKLMVLAFVTPSNAFDPARLDAENPPPEPWTLQPTDPELLEALSRWFRGNGYDLRRLMSLIAKSSAYQLSSFYPGEWKTDYVPFYARRYPRRLDAEEIHDAIVKATGVLPTYVLDYTGSLNPLAPVNWAMQFPDTREPRTNNGINQFLNSFGRGDRDQVTRTKGTSVLLGLNLMNNNFVLQRIHATNAGSTVQRILASTQDPAAITDHLFVASLGRHPTAAEANIAIEAMTQLGITPGTEALQWALLNKVEFLYSY